MLFELIFTFVLPVIILAAGLIVYLGSPRHSLMGSAKADADILRDPKK